MNRRGFLAVLLHVQVAIVLGWTDAEVGSHPWPAFGIPPGKTDYFNIAPIPRYDTDWSATGPLIERYGIELSVAFPGDFGQDGFAWSAQTGADSRSPSPITVPHVGQTPLLAVCYLLLALHKAGKLGTP